MAEPSRSREENVSGKYFIDDQCISCGACWRIAPNHIASHALHTFAFVSRQPSTQEEEEILIQALNTCPVSAIGRNEL